jgi:chromosomal replication initiation ATPase DnaA
MDQLLLDIQPPSIKSLENFVIGDNFEAITIIKKFISSKNPQFFYLWGVEGSGQISFIRCCKKK